MLSNAFSWSINSKCVSRLNSLLFSISNLRQNVESVHDRPFLKQTFLNKMEKARVLITSWYLCLWIPPLQLLNYSNDCHDILYGPSSTKGQHTTVSTSKYSTLMNNIVADKRPKIITVVWLKIQYMASKLKVKWICICQNINKKYVYRNK